MDDSGGREGRAFLLGGAAHGRWQGRNAVGAAPVSKNRLGLSRGPPASMGIVAARLFDAARCEVAGRDHPGALIGATTCCRVRWRRMDRVRGGIFRVRHALCGGRCGVRHAQFDGGRQFAVPFEDGADRGGVGVGDDEHRRMMKAGTAPARRHPLLSGYGRNCPGPKTRNTVTSPASAFLPVSGSTT